MIYACVLLCAFTVPFAYTEKARQYFTDYKANEESDGEVISVEHSIHKRSIPELSINIKRNGYERKYILQSSEGFFAGEKTKIWLARKKGSNFTYVLKNNIMKNVNLTFYHNRRTRSVIAHTVNEEGVSEFNGIIDSDKVIRSLNNVKRFRRDVSSKSLYESKNNSFNNYHVLYKREVSLSNSRNTGYSTNYPYSYDNLKHTLNTPSIVYPEILLYVDKSLFLHFNRNIRKTVAHVLIYWNTVDLYFRELENPLIRLSIAGIVVCEDPIQPMDEFFIGVSALDRYSNFMFTQNYFQFPRNYDIAVLLVNPEKPQSYEGIAYIGGICRKDKEKITSSAIIRDDGISFNIQLAVHELGHLLGTNHDDNKSLSKQQMEKCTFKKGFLMSYHRFGNNQFNFSPCSKENISLTLSSKQAKCVQNNPALDRTDDQMLATFSGQYMSADEQCISREFERALVSPRICQHLECHTQNDTHVLWFAALEGTPCDFESVCLMGSCVKVQSKKNDRNSVLDELFPKHFEPYKSNKTLEEQCKKMGVLNVENAIIKNCKLNCEYTSSDGEMLIRESFNAENGIMCNDNGYCLDGECYDEMSQSAEKQCINFGAGIFLSMSEIECQIVCLKLIYNFHENFNNATYKRTTEKLIISAPDGISCKNDGYCQAGKCVNMTIMSTNINTNDKYKSPKERCKDISMAWMHDFNDGCITYCKNEENKEIDENLVAENGYPCDNNGTCEDGNCIYMTIVSSNIPSTAPSDKWRGFKSPSERCKMIGMSLADNYNEGCIAYCINETKKTDDHLVAENGYPCDNNGICSDGICFNTITTLRTVNTIASTTPLVRLHDDFESPRKRCQKIGMALSYDHDETKCTIKCIEMNLEIILGNKKNSVNPNLTAEDGYPCETNGYCLNGECIKSSANVNAAPFKWSVGELIDPRKGEMEIREPVFDLINEEEENVDEDYSNVDEDVKTFATDLGIDF
ncbi:disintegrin and metalloproteinase domain-containing protein 7-like [Leptopilina heterotoma]|uniref:disintegrin and metalloproteinase domain-containing protein 7-like n=1 Tax=Leptopilina heterotoma TaxID=63436 RepID=UPI001CA7EB01|nr:disintegrin and metalloproteinase domain-containing protein 7-like [Leptopilina heterotoma]